MRSLILTVGIGAALAAGCGRSHGNVAADSTSVHPPAPRSNPRSVTVSSPADSARLRYWSFADQFGESRSAFAKRLGMPVSTSVDTNSGPNHTAGTDSLLTVRYHGLEARFFVGAGHKEFPTELQVTDSGVLRELPVGIGAHRSDLERLFGVPDDEMSKGDTLLLHFGVPEAPPEYVNQDLWFSLVGGVVRKVAWVFFSD